MNICGVSGTSCEHMWWVNVVGQVRHVNICGVSGTSCEHMWWVRYVM